MDPSDITGIARELYRLKDAETVLFGMDLPTLIQAALAVIAGWYALVTHAMLRQNRKKMRADEAERRILQKQYLNSIAPVLRTASFTGNEEELTLDVENLKTNCPAFGACAVAYLPGLGFYADPFHAAIDRSFRFTLNRGGE
ncbi:MAG: protein tyrosine phosphatase-like domain-containing protein [Deltaproteobacteria bacterium]|nr:protein tyrosine phosphatase-like domain-containing protein [Deltaproteobacteria bacterium]